MNCVEATTASSHRSSFLGFPKSRRKHVSVASKGLSPGSRCVSHMWLTKRAAASDHNIVLRNSSWQSRVRSISWTGCVLPGVQITYDVEVGGAIEIKELPFVVGVLGDFTGNPEQPLPKLKERKFVEVNPDNFDTVLEGMKPHLSFAVENKLSDDPDAANLKVDLKFRKFDDFEPANVAKQVKPLKELLDLRTRLSDLRGSLQGNDKLEELLLEAVGNTEKLDKLKGEIGTGGSNA